MEFTNQDMLATHLLGVDIGVEKGIEQGKALAVEEAQENSKKIRSRNFVFLMSAGMTFAIFSFVTLGVLLDLQDKNQRLTSINALFMGEKVSLNSENIELTKQLIKARWDDNVDSNELKNRVGMPDSTIRFTDGGGVCVDPDSSMNRSLQNKREFSSLISNVGDPLEEWIRI